MELKPDNPSWHNNLSNGLEMQGREEEALAMVREIRVKWPDYVFAITRLAIYHSERGEFDEAYVLLDSLNSRKQMHVTEYRSVVTTQIKVLLAQGNIDSAESWLAQMSQAMPDDPAIPDMKRLVKEAKREVG